MSGRLIQLFLLLIPDGGIRIESFHLWLSGYGKYSGLVFQLRGLQNFRYVSPPHFDI